MKKVIIILMLLSTLLFASPMNMEYNCDNDKVHSILINQKLNVHSKSLKGWIRIFNSNDKLYDYGISLSREDRELVLEHFKEKYKEKIKKYNRGVN